MAYVNVIRKYILNFRTPWNYHLLRAYILFTMPRSKKKKGPVKHPIGSPNWQPYTQYSTAIASLMSKERELMITRAINSGRKHGINLTHGKSNPGLGDCAFEAVIFNNNERHCFTDKLPLPIDTYRKIWVTDMANRTVNTE